MPKRKQTKQLQQINISGQELVNSVETDIEYSLDIDPQNLYGFTDIERKTLQVYIDTKSIIATSTLVGTTTHNVIALIQSYKGQQEIRRINKALCQRRFAHKILSIDEIAAWLSSGITDDNITSNEKFTSQQKLTAAKMLLDLQTLKSSIADNPDEILYSDIEQDVKHMSLKSIKNMIHNQSMKDQLAEKEKLINKINVDGLFTQEEIAYMRTLTITELNELLNSVNKENVIDIDDTHNKN